MSGDTGLTWSRSRAGGAGAAVSACLALWLGLFPAFQAAHLVLADHDHCFCSEHSRIEDVPRAASRGVSAPHSADSSPRLGTSPASRPRSNPPDLLLNFSLGREPLLPAAQPAAWRMADSAPALKPRLLEDTVAQPLLLAAPKTSPPAIAVA